MTQNIQLLLHTFFAKNPDIREARNKGLINRRALARYIITTHNLNINKYETLVTALRRFEIEPVVKESMEILKKINISTKEHISILYVEKTEESLRNVMRIAKLIDFNKNETLKFVQGTTSFKIFVDAYNVKKVTDMFQKKDIIKILRDVAELNLIFPKDAPQIRGIISFITTELTINKINITEIITGDPELILYTKSTDVLKAYEVLRRVTTA